MDTAADRSQAPERTINAELIDNGLPNAGYLWRTSMRLDPPQTAAQLASQIGGTAKGNTQRLAAGHYVLVVDAGQVQLHVALTLSP